MIEVWTLKESVVHKQELFTSSFTRKLWLQYKTFQRYYIRRFLNGYQSVVGFLSEYVYDSLSKSRCWQVIQFIPIMMQGELNSRVCQNHAFKLV